MNTPGSVPLGGLLKNRGEVDPNQLTEQKMVKFVWQLVSFKKPQCCIDQFTTLSKETRMNSAMESCPTKLGMAGIGGFALGGMFGLFMSSMRYDAPGAIMGPGSSAAAISDLPVREQLRHGLKDMGRSALSSARNFGKIGAIFAGVECCIEGLRAKNDLGNSAVSGCVTGGILAAGAGPQAVCFGCLGFAAFSVAIDSYMRMPGESTEGRID